MQRSPHVTSARARTVRAAAALLVAIGYVDLVRGGLVVAPLALVAGYVILVPAALLAD